MSTINIRYITAPKLDDAHLGERIICYRPRRNSTPNMQVQTVESKIIAHNYGHGGSGWTLGPGAVNYVNNLFVQSAVVLNLKKDSQITIIGAGVIGLLTAYDLYQKGFNNLRIVAEKFEPLTSHYAGGLISISSIVNQAEFQPILNQIAIETYKFYLSVAKNEHADFPECAKMLPLYCDKTTHSGLDIYIGKVMQPAKNIILDFGNGTTRKVLAFDDALLVYTVRMLQALTNYLHTKQVQFVKQKIKDFAEVDSRVIFNCTGLGAAELNDDQKVVAVQGHLIRLKNQNPADLNYMLDIGFGDFQTRNGQNVSRAFYFFPKLIPNAPIADIGVLGGTFIPGATDHTPNEEEFQIMLQNAKVYCGLDI